eukprot:1918362-Pyramimonas_sp.AAC.1
MAAQHPFAALADAAAVEAVSPFAALADAAVEAVSPFAVLADAAVEEAVSPFAALADAAVEALSPFAALADAVVEEVVSPFAALADAAVEDTVSPFAALADGAVEEASFAVRCDDSLLHGLPSSHRRGRKRKADLVIASAAPLGLAAAANQCQLDAADAMHAHADHQLRVRRQVLLGPVPSCLRPRAQSSTDCTQSMPQDVVRSLLTGSGANLVQLGHLENTLSAALTTVAGQSCELDSATLTFS